MADQRTGYIRNEDAWLTQLQETGQAHVSAPLGKQFDIGLAVDEIRARAAILGFDPDDLEIGAPYVWRLTVRVKGAFARPTQQGANPSTEPVHIGPVETTDGA